MPALQRPFNTLNSVAFLESVLGQASHADVRYEGLRKIAVFRLVKAARHYSEARNLVLAQIDERARWSREPPNGQWLPILEFPAAIDDCIGDLAIAIKSIKALKSMNPPPPNIKAFLAQWKSTINAVKSFRDESQHIDEKIIGGKTNGGPHIPFTSQDGRYCLLNGYELDLVEMGRFIEALADFLALTFPGLELNARTTGSWWLKSE
ncbi:MAG: hypothetical protein J0H86_23230 [Xanthomonadaceae bacterium]|nr:hypothetical protein [Xanthomonadaceae bacterium]